MRFLLITLAAAASVLAQTQPNTVSAAATVTQAIPASTAVFDIQFVDATLTSSVDSAVTTLTPAGITAASLSSVNVAISQGFILTTYNFRLTVPAAELGATRDKIIAIQRTLSNSQTQGLGWSSNVRPSNDDLARALELAMPELLARAKQRAELLATAMNSTLGAVTNLSAPAVDPAGASVTVSLTATYAVTPKN
jgi:hypothetical protein